MAPETTRPSPSAPRLGRMPRIEQLDVLRGMAALWVVLSHYQPYWDTHFGPALVIVPNSVGIHAVELFFIISGFVIFLTLERCTTLLDFVVLRGSRLYPAYWTAILVGTAASVLLWREALWTRGLLANLTMFEEFIGIPRSDNVFWSLSVELAFYVNVAWIFTMGLHRYPRLVVAGWLLATCGWGLLGGRASLDHDHRLWPAVLFVLDYAPYFSMGIVFFDIHKSGWSRISAALLVLAVCTQWLIAGWQSTLVAVFVASLVWLAVRGRLRFLVSRVTLGLGAISYSLYVIHRNLGYKVFDWLHAQGVAADIAIPLVLAGALAAATLMTYGIERPALTLIRRWHQRHVQPAA